MGKSFEFNDSYGSTNEDIYTYLPDGEGRPIVVIKVGSNSLYFQQVPNYYTRVDYRSWPKWSSMALCINLYKD